MTITLTTKIAHFTTPDDPDEVYSLKRSKLTLEARLLYCQARLWTIHCLQLEILTLIFL